MNSYEKIKRIIDDYYSVHEIFYDNHIDIVFEIDLFKFLLDNFNNIQIKYENIDYSDFEFMEDKNKIEYLINSLHYIEHDLLFQFKQFIDRKKYYKNINKHDIDFIMDILSNIRNNFTENNTYNLKLIKELIKTILTITINTLNTNYIGKFELLDFFGALSKLRDSNYFFKIDIENDINILTLKLKELENKNNNNEILLESERLEKEKLVNELEFKNKLFQEQLEKDNESKKINDAIKKLQIPSNELIEAQNKFKENRDNFQKYAMDMFKISIIIFILMTLYLLFFSEINDVSKSISIGYYLTHSFPVFFPTIIGFLFIRQSNINSKELDKINSHP